MLKVIYNSNYNFIMNFTYNNQKEFETGIPDNLEFSNELDHRNFSDEDDDYARSEYIGHKRN